MSVISKMRKQFAVWWQRTGQDEFGEALFAEPEEISCRWDGQTVQFVNGQGEVHLSQAVVYPDRALTVGDRLLEGTLDSDVPIDPMDAGALEVRGVQKTPNFRATETLHTCYL